MTRIAVIDGQGGGIGSAVIKKIREACGQDLELWALGTNVIATTQMMKARANRGASGEKAICYCVQEVDIIIGSISILVANAMMGEITPSIVQAVGGSRARKLLLPITQEAVVIVATPEEPLPHLIERLVTGHLVPIVTSKGRAGFDPTMQDSGSQGAAYEK